MALPTYFALTAVLVCCAAAQNGIGATSGPTGSELLPASAINNLGNLSPWAAKGQYTAPTSNCEITQLSVLERHGAVRYLWLFEPAGRADHP